MRFGFIGDALEWVLRQIVNIIPGGNYAIAVLIFIVIIRLVLMPLDIRSKRSMMRQAKIQPQVDALRKKYEKDPQKMNMKMQELYKKEHVSMLGGCLPILISMPLLFAMFAVIRDISNEGTVLMLLDIKEHLDAGEMDYRPVLQSFLWIKNRFQPDSVFSTVMPEAAASVNNALIGMRESTSVYTPDREGIPGQRDLRRLGRGIRQHRLVQGQYDGPVEHDHPHGLQRLVHTAPSGRSEPVPVHPAHERGQSPAEQRQQPRRLHRQDHEVLLPHLLRLHLLLLQRGVRPVLGGVRGGAERADLLHRQVD